jgi:hypothetical protein
MLYYYIVIILFLRTMVLFGGHAGEPWYGSLPVGVEL